MQKSALKIICLFCLILLSAPLRAQFYIEDAEGRPLRELQYTDVQGSPYLAERWQKGLVRLANGKGHKDIDLKYDQVAEEVIFKSASGKPLRFAEPVREFTMFPLGEGGPALVFRSGYKPIDGAVESTFYQVLADGETQLLRRSYKKVMENKPYGSATTVKTFHDLNLFYLVKNGQPIRIKRDKKTIFTTLEDHTEELDNFVQKNKLSLKEDSDLIMLITFYNSLK